MSGAFKPRPLEDERKRMLELLEAAFDERAELRGRVAELEAERAGLKREVSKWMGLEAEAHAHRVSLSLHIEELEADS